MEHFLVFRSVDGVHWCLLHECAAWQHDEFIDTRGRQFSQQELTTIVDTSSYGSHGTIRPQLRIFLFS